MSLYRIHFKWKDKNVTLRARGLDLTHPYFVSITELQFPTESTRIIDPSQDELKRDFGSAKNLMIPFQTVTLIEELDEERPEPGSKIKPFTVIEKDDDAGDEPPSPQQATTTTGDEEDDGDPNEDTPPTFPHRE